MQTYILHVHRTHDKDIKSLSGLVEDIESCQNKPFHGFTELQSILANSICQHQLCFPNFVPEELAADEKIAVIA